MEEKCSTCKHWQRSHLNHFPSTFGACSLTIVMQGHEVSATSAFWANCTCDEDHNQWIETDEDFGCNQWEPVSETTVIETRDSPARRVYSMLVNGDLGGPLLVPKSTSQKSEDE